ncbi:c-type cytochrome [Elongatibacter sediminis]|uniref:C-type cytochrome n=1 Tax=Elongatibacter sediminis TaxID=3119006 RepID=A0AAW9RH67_9GAMM
MNACVRAAACLLIGFSLHAVADGDAAAGQGKAAICAACHGADGNSAVPQWPKIAGQHEDYLLRQQLLIKSGARPVPEMVGIVAGLNEQDMADLAAWFSEQEPQDAVADEALVEAGRSLWRAGNAESGVPACMACHGPAGEGNPLAGYPRLAGQHAVYTASMLTRFRSGENWGPKDANSHVMNGAASELTDEEIEAVSSYIQGLHLTLE